VLEASMFRYPRFFTRWTGRELFANGTGEGGHVLAIESFTSLGGSLPLSLPIIGVGQRFSLSALDRLRLGENALPLVLLARPRPLDNYGSQPGILACPPRQGCVAATQKLQVIQVRARQAKRPIAFHAEESSWSQFIPTVAALRLTPNH